MNKKAIFEIGSIIHVRYKGFFKIVELTPEEIIESIEFQRFKESYPELTRLAMEGEEKIDIDLYLKDLGKTGSYLESHRQELLECKTKDEMINKISAIFGDDETMKNIKQKAIDRLKYWRKDNEQ
ncbi:MAG: hypothetical protein AABY22_28655 [Nanoarchaeota archaeon]